MHNQCVISIGIWLISEEDMFVWLLTGHLKAETESEIITAQDQTLQTKYSQTQLQCILRGVLQRSIVTQVYYSPCLFKLCFKRH